METITNITNAAAKAVWGETEDRKEPVSGVKGNTAQGEPFDAGNLDTPAQEKVEHNYESHNRDTGLSSTVSDSNRADTTTATGSSTLPTASSNINTSGVTTGTNTDPMRDTATSTTSDINTSTGTGTGTGVNTSTNTSSLGATSGSASSALPTTKDTRDTTAGQNDIRDPDKVDSGSSKPLPNPDDVDTSSSSGPGSTSVLGHEPRTIVDIAKSNGGDAGRDGSNESVNNRPSEGASKFTSEGAGLGSTSGKEDQDRKEEAVEPVHATGLAADGGDFDATKPGAGLEADRLMEEKGIHSPDSGSGSHSHSHGSGSKSSDDKKDKPSLTERIKAKLHKH